MAFPDNAQYTPILIGGSPLFDLTGDESPVSTDIVGNSSFPAAFFAYDGINVYFRLRLNGDPRNPQLTGFRNFSWGVLLNTQGVPGTYDWLFNVDGLNNRISLIRNTNKQVNSWNDPAEGTGGGNPNFVQSITNFDFARVTPANSNFGGDPDFFLDWFLPASTFFSFLGINATSQLQAVFFTSANANNYNKDSLRTNEGFSFSNSLSNPVSPEEVDVRAELSVTKALTSGPSSVLTGQQAIWAGRITITNPGLSQANTVFLEDVLSLDIITSFTVNSVTQGLTAYNSSSRTLSWNVGNLPSGGSATLTFTINGLFTNNGTRTLDSIQGTGFDSFTGTAITSNSAAITISVQSAASINGTIFDQSSGLVLANTTVRLLQGMTVISSTMTNANGLYTFANVSPGNYTVEASRTNYATNTASVTATSGTSTTANISLAPLPGSISGNVSNGGPISNATVNLTSQEGVILASTTTNAAGNYTFASVTPGFYQVGVIAAGFQSQVRSVRVEPNQATVENFVLQGSPGAITGEIRDAMTNAVISNATVELLTPAGVFLTSTTSNAGGEYTFNNLSAGSYLVRASAVNYAASLVSSTVITGSSTTTNIFLQQQQGSITGTVSDDDNQSPISDAVIQVINAQNIVVATATTDASGEYTVEQLYPGSYSLVFTANGYSNQTLGAIVASNSTTVVNANLSRLAGALTGNVQSSGGDPISGAQVSVYQNNILVITALTDNNGDYLITGLAPGTYTAVISAAGHSTHTAAAVITNGETTTVNASLNENPGTLTGVVSDTDDNPVAGAAVTVRLSTGTGIIIATTVTTTDGSYTVEGLAPGNYTVVVTAPNLQTTTKGTTIISDSTSTVSFTLEPDPGSLAGQVTNAQTGDPITGANVQVRILDTSGAVMAVILTDNNGQYEVNQLAPSIYTVIVSAANFQTNIASFQVNSNDTTTGNVALEPTPGQISGFVTDQGGNPIAGALVNVTNNIGALITTALTDSNGMFTVVGLAPGQYTLNVFAPNFQNGVIGALVLAGQTTPVEIALVPNPGAIAGSVTPIVPNTTIQLRDANGLLVDSATANDDGSFSFNHLAPGIYIVSASSPNYSTAQAGVTVEADQTSTVSLTMVANPASVTGIVRDDQGNPVVNATVEIFDLNGTLIAIGFTDAGGNYTVGNLPSGSFTIVANAQGYGQVIAGISLEAGQELTGINFSLVPNPGAINGQITNRNTGDPLESVTVTIIDSNSQLPVAVTTTTLFGNYTIDSLAPGSYIVTASKADFGTEQTGAIVTSGTTMTADLSLAPNPGRITGIVIDSNGNPITDARIQVTVYSEGNILVISLLANTDGTYTVPFLAPGTYFVTVSAPNYSSSTVTAFVESNQTTELTSVLTPNPVTLTVSVTNSSNGTAIEGAAVTVRSQNNIPIISGITDQNGNVSFSTLPSGVLNVSADAVDFGTETATIISSPGDILSIQLALTPNPGNIQGFITNIENGNPIANAAIQLYNIANVLVQTAVSDEFGAYTFAGVTPGVYTVVANSSGFGPETAGAIVEANQISTVSFALFPNPGIVQGFVRDPQNNAPIPGATVVVREFSGTGPIVFTILTDQNGFFQTTTLAPRTYVLIASAEDYGAGSVSVNVASDTVTDTEIYLLRDPGVLQGTVRDTDTSTPLPGTLVRVINNQGIVVGSVQTDVNGFYLIDRLEEGVYSVTAINTDYQTAIRTAEIAANETTNLDFALQGNPAVLSGTVTDSETGIPLTGVVIEVRLSGTDTLVRRTLTDENGNYLIEGLPQGTFDVTAQLRDYAISVNTTFLSPNEMEVLNITLSPFPAAIQGTVTSSETGSPISGALVSVVFANTDIVVESIVTGFDGTYTIGNLPTGNFDIVFSASGFGNVVVPVILSPNETETVNASLPPNPAGINGRVTDGETGAAIEGALIRVFDLFGTFITSSLTDANGDYIISNLASGTYSVIATADGYGNQIGVITLDSGEVETLDFELFQQSASLSGTVRDAANGMPLQSVLVQVFRIGTEIPVASVFTNESGEYVITGLEPREYRVLFSKENYASEVFRIFLEDGESRILDVDLQRNPALIRGQVTDAVTGEPVVRANVTVVITNSGIIVASAETDQNGNYLLPNLPPGSYDVIFSREGYVTQTTSVSLAPNESVVLNVRLEPNPGTVSGNVSAADSLAPIENALIQVFTEDGTFLAETLTDLNGNYTVTGLPAGNLVVIARAIGYQAEFRNVYLDRGENVTVDFLLLPNPATVSGFVTDLCTGEALVQVLVQIFPEEEDFPIRSTLTDVDGFYILTGLPSGDFRVRFSLSGYPVEEYEIELEDGEDASLNAMLGELRLTCPRNVTVFNDPGSNGAIVHFPPPVVFGCDDITAECSPASGSFFPTGRTRVSCSATDAAGNTVSCSFNVRVIVDPCRFFS
ncbi:carboxypeptidase regulatory-like domain-containing protein [Sediminibacillus massiliensis]|uniref:carboxypeptidase regulatory-like domain-containing protein n=1 Tax=Sediminibacillus massiliensis TaxID=1926277 RepID=UPI0015C3DF05|nr:carboxypeptidase regulatory-like domain-containing protein [Sediminibacillus massiliensis]